MKFKSKTHTIEAFKWTGGPDQTEDPEWILEPIKNKSVKVYKHGVDIKTADGLQTAHVGDYIVKDGNKIYPLTEAALLEKYEAEDIFS
jgi:hypothetical protein